MKSNDLKPTNLSRTVLLTITLLACACLSACEQPKQTSNNKGALTANETPEPTIEASPTSQNGEQWQVISSDSVTLTVTAPRAKSARILYRPAFADRHVQLKKLNTPSDIATGKFSTQLKVPSDFAGEVWAEVTYEKGEKKQTKPIALTVEDITPAELADADYKHTEESARSDKITGGRVEKAELQPGKGDIRVTVNIPAFQLTLWQGGKEIKTYEIGIGRKEFQLPSGLRHARQIIFNPDWIPPDSEWVYDHDVAPGERVEADDPRNPLGKIKIPIGGEGILIHQAFKPSDVGGLVSHGCARLRLDELYDLIDKIIAARALTASRQQIERAKSSKDRFVINLDAPLVVDISYDTLVVEGGALHIYPDVYDQKKNTVENLRAELQEAGVEASKLDDNVLRQMLGRVSKTEQFVVSVTDLKAGRFEGQNQPLIATATVPKKPAVKGKRSR